jgi:hypothetical protein
MKGCISHLKGSHSFVVSIHESLCDFVVLCSPEQEDRSTAASYPQIIGKYCLFVGHYGVVDVRLMPKPLQE